MARFDIDTFQRKGKRITWTAQADEGETLVEVCNQVKLAASKHFGIAAPLRSWSVMQASNGCITVTMRL